MGFVIAGGIGSLGPSEIQVLIPVAAAAGKGEGGHIRGGPGGLDWLALALSGKAGWPCGRAALAALLVQLLPSIILSTAFLYDSRSLNVSSPLQITKGFRQISVWLGDSHLEIGLPALLVVTVLIVGEAVEAASSHILCATPFSTSEIIVSLLADGES